MKRSPRLALLLLCGAMAVSLWRTVRAPNDWAEAHWLLDYRFGFVKRGLLGQLLSWTTDLCGVPITTNVTAGVGYAMLALFVGVLLAIAWRIADRDDWRPATVLVLVAFLTSSFAVLTGHLCGYFDHVFYVLGALSIALALRGRVWAGALVQALALLVHESCILLVYPAFAFACVLPPATVGTPPRWPWLPLLLPVAMAGVMAIVLSTPPAGFAAAYTAHLQAAGFVAGGMAENTPKMLTFSLWQMWQLVSSALSQDLVQLRERHLCSAVTMLPTVLLLAFGGRRRWPQATALRPLLAAVVVAPLAMHAVAWDVERIWSYAIASAFLAAWVLAERRAAAAEPSPLVLPCAGAVIVANLLLATNLFDGTADRLALPVRAIVAVLLVMLAVVYARARRTVPA